MDPTECYQQWLTAMSRDELTEAIVSCADLRRWIDRGGFDPEWTEVERARFFGWAPWKDERWASLPRDDRDLFTVEEAPTKRRGAHV